jgi:ABC-type transport system substrate-binding protein
MVRLLLGWPSDPGLDVFRSLHIGYRVERHCLERPASRPKKFNELVVMARSETDEAMRKEQYWEAQRLLQDDGGAIVGMWASFIHAHSKGSCP